MEMAAGSFSVRLFGIFTRALTAFPHRGAAAKALRADESTTLPFCIRTLHFTYKTFSDLKEDISTNACNRQAVVIEC